MRKLVLPVAAAAAVAALIAGCSSNKPNSSGSASSANSASSASSANQGDLSSLPASQIADKAKAALSAAQSFHVAGTVTSDGQPGAIDMNFTATGSSGSVTLSGSKIELVALGKTVYFKAPDEFWKKEAGAAAGAVLPIVSGKWIKASTDSSQFSELAGVADKQSFLDQAFRDYHSADVTKIGQQTVNGADCVVLKYQDTTVSVDRSTAQPVAVASTGSTAGKVVIDHYNSEPAPTAPPATQTIDASMLGG